MLQISTLVGIQKAIPHYLAFTMSVCMLTINSIMSQSIAFAVIEGKKNAQACITQKNLLQFHISSPDKNSEKAILLKRDDDLGDCLNLAEMIPQSSIRYDVNDQRLDIDVPRHGL